MKTLNEVVKFLEDYVIECNPDDGCGRCNEARECVESLKSIAERMPTNEDETYKRISELRWDGKHIEKIDWEKFYDDEVERRIVARIPTEEEADKESKEWLLPEGKQAAFRNGFMRGYDWFRSRIEEKPEEEYIDKSISIDEYMEKNPKLDPHEQ
jgi:hypothetical protein